MSRMRLFVTDGIREKLDRGEWSHAGGDAKCDRCGRPYFDHDELALPPGSGWFAMACDGRLLKL